MSLLLPDNLTEQPKIFQEIILILVLRIHFQNADYPIVFRLNQVVQLWAVCKWNHSIDNVFAEDLVRVATDLSKSLLSPICLFFVCCFVNFFFRLVHFNFILRLFYCLSFFLLVDNRDCFRSIALMSRRKFDQAESSTGLRWPRIFNRYSLMHLMGFVISSIIL